MKLSCMILLGAARAERSLGHARASAGISRIQPRFVSALVGARSRAPLMEAERGEVDGLDVVEQPSSSASSARWSFAGASRSNHVSNQLALAGASRRTSGPS